MILNRKTSRFAAWLALLALVLNAAWPGLANAAPRKVSGLSDICSVVGMHAGADAGGSLPATDKLPPHCAFCSLASDKLIAPPPPGVPVLPSSGITPRPHVESPPATGIADFLLAAPRAPPPAS